MIRQIQRIEKFLQRDTKLNCDDMTDAQLAAWLAVVQNVKRDMVKRIRHKVQLVKDMYPRC